MLMEIGINFHLKYTGHHSITSIPSKVGPIAQPALEEQ